VFCVSATYGLIDGFILLLIFLTLFLLINLPIVFIIY
jgi:hypothetical protein